MPRKIPLDCFLLAERETAKTPVLLCGVVELGMNAWVPDEVHMEPVLEVKAALFLELPHLEPMRVERHDL